jgi:hypothetical protein
MAHINIQDVSGGDCTARLHIMGSYDTERNCICFVYYVSGNGLSVGCHDNQSSKNKNSRKFGSKQ